MGGASRFSPHFLSSTPYQTYINLFFLNFVSLGGGGSRPNILIITHFTIHVLCISSFNLISILDSHISILLKEINALFNMPSYLNIILLCTFVKKILGSYCSQISKWEYHVIYFNHQMLRKKVNLIALLTDPDLICVLLFCLYFNILDYIWRAR